MGKPGSGAMGGFTRRDFLGAAAVGAAALGTGPLWAEGAEQTPALADAIAKLQYLTPPQQFRGFVREKPAIDQFTPAKLREVGLDRETWRLEVTADPEGGCKLDHPLTRENGAALTFDGLMKLAEKRVVRYMRVLTCTNVAEPFGMGLWEGVPLRDVIWLAGPSANTRRVYYHGYHNDDPKQRFVSSLPIGRVLEDAPGELPVILCYKLNGQVLSPKGGGPVRVIVPEAYGNKAVKWLQRIVLTNSFHANDTYAEWNNDVESQMKTFARFINPPAKSRAGDAMPIVGMAQVGMSGLSRVQYSIQPQDAPLPADDPYLTKLEWQDARILPPPANWGGGLPDGKLPPIPLQFDENGRPRIWPLRYGIAYWAALLPGLRAGTYRLRCRSIDANGIAQPMPRPFARSGNNGIQVAKLVVE